MKYRLLVAMMVFVFYAFGRDDGLRNAVPAMSDLGQGTLTEAGSRNAFEKATGIPLPGSVKPKLGKFRVWNEKDYGGRNRSYHTAAFVAPPADVLALADAVESKWRSEHGTNPDVRIDRSSGTKERISLGGMEFGPGAFSIQVMDRYAGYSELFAQLSIDPTSGNIWLTHYRGTQDNPSSRLEEEEWKKEEEREAKIRAQEEALWRKQQESE